MPEPAAPELYDIHMLDQLDAYLTEARAALVRVLVNGPDGSEQDAAILAALRALVPPAATP